MADGLEARLSRRDLKRRFGCNEACLQHLIRIRQSELCVCGKGGECGPLYRVRASAFRSRICGHLIWPASNTLFHNSNIDLSKWFEALWLFSISRNGLTVNFTQRYFGISHVAAWRLLTRLRMHITLLRERVILGSTGREVVVTDSDIKSVKSTRSTRTSTGKVVAISDGEEMYTFLIPRRRPSAVARIVRKHLAVNSRIAAADRPIYRSLSGAKSGLQVRYLSDEELLEVYAWREIAGYWLTSKGMLAGTYKHFREKNLMGYLKEFEWRHANRNRPDYGFGTLISEFPVMPSGTPPINSLVQ